MAFPGGKEEPQAAVGVATFSPPKIPAKLFLSGSRSGKRSNSSKVMSEKRLSIPYRRACHGQDTFFAGFIDQDPHGKSIFFLSGSSCIPEGAFLSGDFGREKCWDPQPGRRSSYGRASPCADCG